MSNLPVHDVFPHIQAQDEYFEPLNGPHLFDSPNSVCPGCGGDLDLLQPDPCRGESLLGVCCDCPAWYLIDGRNGTVVDLGVSARLG